MLKIDIVSGFLGAGKTTFIKRLLQTKLQNEKIVLIENEFGEVSVDSLFLADSKVDIAELSLGCICCSLVGDFAKSLNEVIEKYNPDRIIVEPSGVGKLSDVIKAISDAGLMDYLNTYVCLVDASKAKVYAKNFKEFFADQIAYAKTVVLSRSDVTPEEKLLTSLEVIRNINHECNVVTTPINDLCDEELLKVYEGVKTSFEEELVHEHNECTCECHHEHHHHHEECDCDSHHEHHHHHEECDCDCHHEHHHHHEECDCDCHHEHHHHHEECKCGCHHEHHQHAEDVFNSISVETAKVYCFNHLKQLLEQLAYSNVHGNIVRAKGIVKTTEGWKKFNITPEELIIEDSSALAVGLVCVIGVHLEEKNIKELF